jgi:hypothetical protein
MSATRTTMKSKLFLCLAVVVLNVTVYARAVRIWSEAELANASDVVVIGHPIAVKDLDETNTLGFGSTANFQSRFRGVESTFEVSEVLKGSPGNDEIVLHHYREEWGSPPNGPSLASFSPSGTNEYVLYLVQEESNRFAPVAGQMDAWISIKSMPTDVPRIEATPVMDEVKLKFVSVDSEETNGEDGHGENAVDGSPGTIWHTQWQGNSPAVPHEIILELPEATVIKAFTYLPRQDESDHGTIKDYEFYVSDDGKDFGEPVKKGGFAPGKCKQIETFEPIKCRFVKLRAISEINGLPWTSAAEIGVDQCAEE